MASAYVNIRVEVPNTTVAQLESKFRNPNTDATASNYEAVQLLDVLFSALRAGAIDGEVRVGFGTAAVAPDITGGSAITISNLK
jgi:hypothetical protein